MYNRSVICIAHAFPFSSAVFIFYLYLSLIYFDFISAVLLLLVNVKVSLDFREIPSKRQYQRNREVTMLAYGFKGRRER